MYIFDEAASNVDIESEEQIMVQVEQLAATKTVLLISHRLANVVHADKIYVIEDGTVQESGTHTVLLEKNGAYAKLWHAQQALENYGKAVETE